MNHRHALMAALLALCGLYGVWFGRSADWTALAVFALPPLLLAASVWVRTRAVRFWSGVLALLWFSHGVMAAWSQPDVRGLALIEIALALAVIIASNAVALRARSARRAERNASR